MAVEEHNIDRSAGSGSAAAIDDKYDGEEYSTKDKRAETRTTYYKRDVERAAISERQKQHLKRALRWHEGEGAPNRKDRNNKEWQRRRAGTICARVDLTPYQKRRVMHLIHDVLDINSFGPYSTEKVALGVVNVVAREDGRWIEDEPQFKKLAGEFDVKPDKLRQIRSLVRERLPSYDA